MHAFLPAALALAGALLFYLGSPRQQWLRAPLRPRPSRSAATLLSIGALFVDGGAQAFATSLSIVMTASMTGFVACPFIGVLLGRLRIAPAAEGRGKTRHDAEADTPDELAGAPSRGAPR